MINYIDIFIKNIRYRRIIKFLSVTSFAKTLSWGQKLSANKKNG